MRLITQDQNRRKQSGPPASGHSTHYGDEEARRIAAEAKPDVVGTQKAQSPSGEISNGSRMDYVP